MPSILPEAYVVELMYVAEDEQNGAAFDDFVRATNPSLALGKALANRGLYHSGMPFRSFAVFKVSEQPCLEDN